MKKILLPLLFAGFSATAWAQAGDVYVSFGQSMLSSNGIGSDSTTGSKDDYKLKDGFRFGFRFGFHSEGHTGHEFGYAYNRSRLSYKGTDIPNGGMAIHQGGYNYLLYATKDGSRVRPFATGGVHFSNFVPPGSSSYNGRTKFGVNYGGGVKFYVGDKWAVRLDVRQYATGKPDFGLALTQGWIRQLEVSAGFGIRF